MNAKSQAFTMPVQLGDLAATDALGARIAAGLGVGDALRESRQMANANGVGAHMLLVLVLWLISFVASGALGIGLRGSSFGLGTVVDAITLPFTFAVVVGAYARLLGYGHLVEAVGRQER